MGGVATANPEVIKASFEAHNLPPDQMVKPLVTAIAFGNVAIDAPPYPYDKVVKQEVYEELAFTDRARIFLGSLRKAIHGDVNGETVDRMYIGFLPRKGAIPEELRPTFQPIIDRQPKYRRLNRRIEQAIVDLARRM